MGRELTPDGKDDFSNNSGDFFEGRWSRGVKHGFFKNVIYNDGAILYSGDIKNERIEGKILLTRLGRGKITHVGDHRYEGNFVDGEYEGKLAQIRLTKKGFGILEQLDGGDSKIIYSGEFLRNEKSGKGYQVWYKKENSEGGKYFVRQAYTGEWKEGKMHGEGVYELIRTSVTSVVAGTKYHEKMQDSTIRFENGQPVGELMQICLF